MNIILYYIIYKITIDEHEHSFKLKKEKYIIEEKINKIREYLEISSNLNVATSKKDITQNILNVVKSKLFKNINNEDQNIKTQSLEYLFFRLNYCYDFTNGIISEGAQNFKFIFTFSISKIIKKYLHLI